MNDSPIESSVVVTINVNGVRHELATEARTTLATLLRDQLLLTGTHVGCEHGVCGACTVLVDGASARACLLFGFQVDGSEIETIEGLGRGCPDGMGPLQQACHEHHSFQCGFCTPGILMAATELLAEGRSLTRAEVREALAGNLCRCTGYDSIVEAVFAVANSGARSVEPEADG